MGRHALFALFVGLALACDGGLEPTPACPTSFVGICGTATFRGAKPDSTDLLYLVAYDSFPKVQSDFFKFKPFPPPTIPAGGPPYLYQLGVPSGRYEWVVAVWKKIGTLSPDGSNADTLLRAAGFYRNPADTSRPGTVTVGSTRVQHIDFLVDFDHMRRICDFVPPCM